MGFLIYSIDKTIDSKYIVVKSIKEQARVGALVHIMDARETSDGITVKYRVTQTKQDYVIKFDTIKQFCEWVMPSVFLARYYDNLSHREIISYIHAENRSFLTFHLPIILICLVIIWVCALFLITGVAGIAVGASLSVTAVAGVFLFDKISVKLMHERLYDKVTNAKPKASVSG